jgi:hypothetical protein
LSEEIRVHVHDEDRSPPKRRGRPPKESTPLIKSGLSIQLPSPRRMLSLKEKLAMKGKSFKIVVAKSKQPLGLPVNLRSARSTPSVAKEAQASFPHPSPSAINDRASVLGRKDSTEQSPSATTSVRLNGNSPVTTARVQPTQLVKKITKMPTVVRLHSPDPVRKAPTVVRLDNPDEDSGPEDYASSGSSSDESIPAVRPALKIARAGIGRAERFDTANDAVNGGSQRRRGTPLMRGN